MGYDRSELQVERMSRVDKIKQEVCMSCYDPHKKKISAGRVCVCVIPATLREYMLSTRGSPLA